jgi:predicted nucleic acid-binding Zn ribbon protein
MKKIILTESEQARLYVIERQGKKCPECGETKIKKLFQIRKVATKTQGMGFYVAKTCKDCENAGKRQKRISPPAALVPENMFVCRVPPVQMSQEIRRVRREGAGSV